MRIMFNLGMSLLMALSVVGADMVLSKPVPAAAAPSNALLATPAPEWTNLFTRTSGWLGGDGFYSIPLNGNDAIGSATSTSKSMFLFSDTLIGNVNSATLATSLTGFVNHSSAVLTGNTPNPTNTNFVYGSLGDLTNTNIFQDNLWLNDGIAIGNTIYLTGFKHDSAFDPTQLDLISIPIVNGEPNYSAFSRTQGIAPFYRDSDYIVMFGVGYLDNSAAAGAPNPDGYVYVYGYRNTLIYGAKDLVVARVPRASFSDFSQWRYWDGSTWNTSIAASMVGWANLASDVSTELSVTPINSGIYNGKYMLVYTKGVFSNSLEYRIADSPVGPFGAPVRFYQCEEPYIYGALNNNNTFCYNAKAHPHLSQSGELLVSYNVNQHVGLPSTNQIYRPRFVRINLNTFGTLANPRDTQVNVALNKAVTANANSSAAGRAVNGAWRDVENDKWSALITDTNGYQWLQLDLGSSYPISRWIVKHAGYAGEPTSYNTRDFTLQKSSNGTTWTNVDTVIGNTHNITDRFVDSATATARYFRLLIAKPTQSTDGAARIYEWELYQTTSGTPGNLALYRPSITKTYNTQAQRAVDGHWSNIHNDKWVDISTGAKWIAVDLGDDYLVNRWVVKHAGIAGESVGYNTRSFKLQSSSDGLSWTDQDSVTANTLNITDRTVSVFTARYVRLYITDAGSDNRSRIYEFEVYGQ